MGTFANQRNTAWRGTENNMGGDLRFGDGKHDAETLTVLRVIARDCVEKRLPGRYRERPRRTKRYLERGTEMNIERGTGMHINHYLREVIPSCCK